MKKFTFICTLSILFLIIGKVFGQSCKTIKAGKTNVNARLTGFQFVEINDTSLHDCVRECLSFGRCKSFNYGQDNKKCELNDADSTDVTSDQFQATGRNIYSDISAWPKSIGGPCAGHTCNGNQRCYPVTGGGHVCRSTDCDETLPQGFTFADTGTITIGSVRAYKSVCPPRNVWKDIHTVTCGNNRRWSQVDNYCEEIQTCADVKQCNPSYEDGEYWIYAEAFGGKRVKIYCHGMRTSAPSEYVTVDPDYNYSIDGGDPSGTGKFKTVTKFSKIRVNMKNMDIVRWNANFTEVNGFSNSFSPYAWARSCNYYKRNRKLGRFSISTKGTGFKFSSTVTWKKSGYIAYKGEITRNDENTEISIYCGGHCGLCNPNGPLILYYNQNIDLDEGSAILTKCV